MVKQRKHRLFKNDVFGIKGMIFTWRITRSIKKRNHLTARQLECLLNTSTYIGLPKTEEEVTKMEWIFETYKTLISEIESDMKRVKDKIYDWRLMSGE